MVVSEHELIDVADLELFMGAVDLETQYGYADATVNAWISLAENMVIGITKVTWTATTLTDNVKAVVLLWAKQFTLNQMIQDGHTSRTNPESKNERYLTEITKGLTEVPRTENDATRNLWMD